MFFFSCFSFSNVPFFGEKKTNITGKETVENKERGIEKQKEEEMEKKVLVAHNNIHTNTCACVCVKQRSIYGLCAPRK